MPPSDQDARAQLQSSASAPAGSEERRHELNGMLDTIAAQLLDADRRHTATLNEIQERVAVMGREAELIRNRVPEQFASAFARVEAGVAELGQRLSNDGGSKRDPSVKATTAPMSEPLRNAGSSEFQPDPKKSEAPMALRSANALSGVERRQPEAVDRRKTPVDNFDVIESSSSDDADPWDSQSAEALARVYDVKALANAPVLANGGARLAGAGADKSGVNEVWLENRFAEIGKSIERSLANFVPEADRNELGRKFEQFEQRLSKKFEGVATQADIGVVRLIEAHVGEVVNHLVQTHDQLARLNIIEEQLGVISLALADVQGGGAALSPKAARSGSAPAVDVDAIARAAAERTAQRFAETRNSDRHAGAEELRPLIERLMADSRRGGESTARLLDTIQQSMIRISERVETIERVQRQSRVPANNGDVPAREADRAPLIPNLPPARPDPSTSRSLTNVSAALAATMAQSSHDPDRAPARETADGHQLPGPRNPERQRHDFIADARRARNRLSVADEVAEVVIANTAAPQDTPLDADAAKDPLEATRPIKPVAADTPKATSPSGPSPRLIAITLGTIVLLSGLWYAFGGGDAVLSLRSAVSKGNVASDVNTGKTSPAGADKPSSAASQPDVNGKRGDIAPQGQPNVRPASAEAPVPRTTLPLIGIAVDVDSPTTATELQQAMRRQSMATMSGEIGAEAAKSPAATAVPASIVPNQNQAPGRVDGAIAPNALTRAKNMSETDMPPATLGPLSLRLAAANGDPSAQFEIGARFADGKGKTSNFNDAAKWYQRSADKGFAQAQYRLGTLYERGLGLKPDRALAIKWYQLAAAQGNIKAMHNLAVLSSNQNDKSPDYASAAHWFEEAAKRDLSDSQFNLAILYENGLGVPRDMKTAFKWLSLAAREGDAEAVRRRDILRGKLTVQEMAAAQALIAGYKPLPYERTVNDARAAGEAWKKNPANGVSG